MIALFLLAAVALATPAAKLAMPAAAPPDGAYSYSVSAVGVVSDSTITVKRAADGLHVSEVTDIAGKHATASLALDLTTLAPLSYSATYLGSQDVSLAFNVNGASETVYGQTAQPVMLAPLPGAPRLVILDGALLSGFVMLPAIAAITSDTSVTGVLPARAANYAVSLNRNLKPPHPQSVPAGDVPLSSISPTAFTIWYDPKTFVMHELDVPLQNVIVTLVKYTAAAGGPSAVASAKRGEHGRERRPVAIHTIARR
jgi:hypothetical protein